MLGRREQIKYKNTIFERMGEQKSGLVIISIGDKFVQSAEYCDIYEIIAQNTLQNIQNVV